MSGRRPSRLHEIDPAAIRAVTHGEDPRRAIGTSPTGAEDDLDRAIAAKLETKAKTKALAPGRRRTELARRPTATRSLTVNLPNVFDGLKRQYQARRVTASDMVRGALDAHEQSLESHAAAGESLQLQSRSGGGVSRWSLRLTDTDLERLDRLAVTIAALLPRRVRPTRTAVITALLELEMSTSPKPGSCR